MSKKVILLILDGWGIGNKSKSDVIFSTPTPNMDSLLAKYPHAQLLTSGENVGLPDGQMGNSEVGHLNIGAGRVLYQDLVKINKAIRENTIAKNPELVKVYEKIQNGIWVYNGVFKLVDAKQEKVGKRKLFKFRLEITQKEWEIEIEKPGERRKFVVD